jgi:hypothetical protein
MVVRTGLDMWKSSNTMVGTGLDYGELGYMVVGTGVDTSRFWSHGRWA